MLLLQARKEKELPEKLELIIITRKKCVKQMIPGVLEQSLSLVFNQQYYEKKEAYELIEINSNRLMTNVPQCSDTL